MRIFDDIEIVNGYRAIFVKKLNAIVISDLQLGHELYLAEEKGIFIPQTQLKEMEKDLNKIFEITKAERLIINGDFKHEFGEASRQEWREVKDFVEFAKRRFKEIILVRGNHDNYLLTIASNIGLKVFNPFYYEKGIIFTHGHKKIEYPKNVEVVVIGHEQPALLLKEKFDKIKVPCLLYGKMKDGKKIICLPAFSPLASGSEINVISKEDILSPILREEVEIEELIPIAISKETGALKFPQIKKLIIS